LIYPLNHQPNEKVDGNTGMAELISDDDIEPSGSHLFRGSVRTDLLKRSAVGFVSFFHVHFLWNFLSFFPPLEPPGTGRPVPKMRACRCVVCARATVTDLLMTQSKRLD